MERPNLNLARKWRSRTFDELVGQELSVRILKNSLYLNHIVPVYLLSGQRGCGKTSVARIFAAALNCDELAAFRERPKERTVPCLNCRSCKALIDGQHPDFVEIDAASHTGVDNVRNIIDAASFMPVMGNKKIYLIDEAHMLSKAAFNALLKILEEPPPSAMFMLATTDVHKVPETVRSRCFQLLFRPVAAKALHEHLEVICQDEAISYEEGVLELLVGESDGSVRDALNALDQLRLSCDGPITIAAIHALYCHVDDAQVISLLRAVLQADQAEVIRCCSALEEHGAAIQLYKAFRFSVQEALYHMLSLPLVRFVVHEQAIAQAVASCSSQQLAALLHTLCSQELSLLRATDQHLFLQSMLLNACVPKKNVLPPAQPPTPPAAIEQKPLKKSAPKSGMSTIQPGEQKEVTGPSQASLEVATGWQRVVAAVAQLDDPLLHSIFTQARYKDFDEQKKQVVVSFGKQLVFFNEWLDETKSLWQPLLAAHYGNGVQLKVLFDQESGVVAPTKSTSLVTHAKSRGEVNPVPVRQTRRSFGFRSSDQKQRERVIDVSNKEVWAKTQSVLEHFPGVVVAYTPQEFS